MQDVQARWARTLMWIGLVGGVVLLLFTAIFSAGPQHYAASFSLILFAMSDLVRRTRPRLANVCAVLGFVASVAYIVLTIIWITR